MQGSFLALLSAVFFALTMIFIRRAVLRVSDASLGTLISVPMAVPMFFVILVVTGQTQTIFRFSREGYVWLSAAGILHFVVGRSLNYKLIQLVGANVGTILRRANILVSFIIGVFVLHEPLNWPLVIGVSLIITGITLPGLSRQMFLDSGGHFSKIPAKGFFLGFLISIVFGVSPIFVKLGLKESNLPLAGAFVSFLAATAVLSVSLISRKRRASIAHITIKAAGLVSMVGLMSFTANLLRYAALGMAPASVVVPLISISPIFLLFFSFTFNRKLEIFNRSVIVGTVLVVFGSILLI